MCARVVDVGVVLGPGYVLEAVHQLWIVFDPAQQRVVDAVVDAPLDPLHVARLAGRDDCDAVACMWWQQVTHTLCAEVGRGKDNGLGVHLIAAHLTLQHQAQQRSLHGRVGLAILVDHQDDRLPMQVQAQLLVGGEAHVVLPVQILHLRDHNVAEVFGRAVEVARDVLGHIV